MDINEFELLLFDRIEVIKNMDKKYDFEKNAAISFSGGKDSCVLSALIDLALPGNKIPRIYANTGIEYADMLKFVREKAAKDDRFIILNQNKNITKTLEKYGYPFKSKLHAQKVLKAQRLLRKGKEISPFLKDYINIQEKTYYRKCPKILVYQFKEVMPFLISDQCCVKLKKSLLEDYHKKENRYFTITGMRAEEGGARSKLTCITHNGTKFHPLIVISDEWEKEFIDKYDIKLCRLYYPHFNFERTGCKGCPFAINLEHDLARLEKYLPAEYAQCQRLWKPVYDEYRRLNYRIGSNRQLSLEDYLEFDE